MPDLSAKTVLVTGASKGIGAATATALAVAGAYVVAHYNSDRAGAEAALAAVPDERKCFVAADLNDLAAVEKLWDEAASWRGGIDVLVLNAAIMLWNGGMHETLDVWDGVWERTLAVNVLAPARLLRRAVPHFRGRGGGILVTLSSWAAQRGVSNPDTVAYGASKAAVRSMTQTIARAYARENLLAYIVAPGVVRTQMSESFAATQGGEAAVSSSLAMGEWVPPEEIASLVTYLAGGEARHLTGATLDMNGASYIR